LVKKDQRAIFCQVLPMSGGLLQPARLFRPIQNLPRLGVETLKFFNERNIDDLIVVNAKREPVGLVDSQDLPKLKIV
jgi:hypothetical protein